jgi:hypothetical protein
MNDRMIQCPWCDGDGKTCDENAVFGPDCGLCAGAGIIPDRRAPSAAEDALRAEVERLQAELEKYVTPLTDEQAEHLASYHDNTAANWRYLDGEIRAAREGER